MICFKILQLGSRHISVCGTVFSGIVSKRVIKRIKGNSRERVVGLVPPWGEPGLGSWALERLGTGAQRAGQVGSPCPPAAALLRVGRRRAAHSSRPTPLLGAPSVASQHESAPPQSHPFRFTISNRITAIFGSTLILTSSKSLPFISRRFSSWLPVTKTITPA